MPLTRGKYLDLNSDNQYQIEYFGNANGILKSFIIKLPQDQLKKGFTQNDVLDTMDLLAKDQYAVWKKQMVPSNLNVDSTRIPDKVISDDKE